MKYFDSFANLLAKVLPLKYLRTVFKLILAYRTHFSTREKPSQGSVMKLLSNAESCIRITQILNLTKHLNNFVYKHFQTFWNLFGDLNQLYRQLTCYCQ